MSVGKTQRQYRVAQLLAEEAVTSQGQLVDLLARDGLYARLHSYSSESEASGSRASAPLSTNGASVPQSVSGTWSLSLESPRGRREGILELSVNGSSLSGTWTGERGAQQFDGGAVEGPSLSWEVRMAGPMGEISLRFSGLLADGVISGEVEFGAFGKGKFQATRTESAPE